MQTVALPNWGIDVCSSSPATVFERIPPAALKVDGAGLAGSEGEAEFFQDAGRGGVFGVTIGFDVSQIQRLQAELEHGASGLGGVTTAPMFDRQFIAQFSARGTVMGAANADVANELAGVAQQYGQLVAIARLFLLPAEKYTDERPDIHFATICPRVVAEILGSFLVGQDGGPVLRYKIAQ